MDTLGDWLPSNAECSVRTELLGCVAVHAGNQHYLLGGDQRHGEDQFGGRRWRRRNCHVILSGQPFTILHVLRGQSEHNPGVVVRVDFPAIKSNRSQSRRILWKLGGASDDEQ